MICVEPTVEFEKKRGYSIITRGKHLNEQRFLERQAIYARRIISAFRGRDSLRLEQIRELSGLKLCYSRFWFIVNRLKRIGVLQHQRYFVTARYVLSKRTTTQS